MKSSVALVTGAVVCLLGAACSTKYIPHTTVEDTPDNREIMALVERYRLALEQRDVPTLLSLASPAYFDTRGTAEPSDDYDYKGLDGFLQDHFKDTKDVVAMQVDLTVQEIIFSEDKPDEAQVQIHFVSRYQLHLPAGDKWQANEDVHRMRLVREQGRWMISSGM